MITPGPDQTGGSRFFSESALETWTAPNRTRHRVPSPILARRDRPAKRLFFGGSPVSADIGLRPKNLFAELGISSEQEMNKGDLDHGLAGGR